MLHGHRKILHALVGVGSTALAAAAALVRQLQFATKDSFEEKKKL